MGFWSDAGKALSATGGALSEGMELLAEGASELERATHRMLLETRIKLHESERARVGEAWFASSNTEKSSELADTYAELLRDYPEDTTGEARDQFKKLQADRRNLAVEKQVQSVTALNDRVKSTDYRLAIDAIRDRKRLIGLLEDLRRLGTADEHSRLVSRAGQRIEELQAEIDDLEPERIQTEFANHPSGARKSKRSRFDGKLSGTYTEWNEDSQLIWSVPFSQGEIKGEVKHWRDDGTPLLETHFDGDMKTFTAFSVSSQPLLNGELKSPDMAITLSFSELNGVRFHHRLGATPSKLRFAWEAMKSPRMLAFIWRCRGAGPQADRLHELTELGDQISLAMNELMAIRESG